MSARDARCRGRQSRARRVCREHSHALVIATELGEALVVVRRPRCVMVAVTVTYWGTT